MIAKKIVLVKHSVIVLVAKVFVFYHRLKEGNLFQIECDFDYV